MARLSREQLFQQAAAVGWEKGTPMTPAIRQAVKTRIRNKLTEADTAPTRVFEADGTFRPMKSDEAVDNLLEELET